MTRAAFHGTFSDFKIIRTRSAAQFVIEVPLERADEALAALGGLPQPGTERPVAVARLVEEPKPTAPAANPFKSLQGKEAYANKDDMQKAVTRAALLCKDRAFQVYMATNDEKACAAQLCQYIATRSRSDIGSNPDTFRAFLNLEEQYRTHQQIAGYSPHLTGARQ